MRFPPNFPQSEVITKGQLTKSDLYMNIQCKYTIYNYTIYIYIYIHIYICICRERYRYRYRYRYR